jgi:Regulator of chromosome condensation (RCC1) repeat
MFKFPDGGNRAMTFLPIVARELRAASRRRGTYWVRLVVATLAIFVGAVIFLIYLGLAPPAIGQAIFIWLSSLAMAYCLASGRLATSDCLSQEKREGTLGLLFLTDLKGYDVVLGKLVATSLGAFYGLIAIMPVMAVPLLLGGSGNAQFWRTGLVLLVTFLFSLSVGMLASALSRDARRAAAANFALILLLTLILPAAIAIGLAVMSSAPTPDEAFAPSPIFSLFYGFDVFYRTKLGAAHFWISLGAVFAIMLLLLALASVIVPRTWQDKSAPQVRTRRLTWRGFWRALSYGRLVKQAPHRKRLLDVNAFYWLSARARLKPLHVWIFLGLTVIWWTWGWIDAEIAWYDPLIAITLAMILNATLKSWVSIEAGQQLAEDRDGGALELLLSTPMTVRDILHGQYLALRRQFLKPVFLVIALELVFMEAEARNGSANTLPAGMVRPLWLAAIVILVADLIALTLTAVRTALTARNANRATISTMSRVLFLPWVLFAIGSGIANLWAALFANNGYFPGLKTYVGLWFGVSLAVDLFFGLRSWKQLRTSFREIASRQTSSVSSNVGGSIGTQSVGLSRAAASPLAALVDAIRAIAPARSMVRRILVAGGAVVFVVVSLAAWRDWAKPAFPPAIKVSITQSNGPLRVVGGFASSGALLILPDDSLWRWGAASPVPGFAGSQPQSRAAAPEKVGSGYDWVQISDFGNHSVGLRKDGTIWEWGWLYRLGAGRYFQGSPVQVGVANDWLKVSAGGGHSVALKKDGTLWAWGDNSKSQFGNGAGPSSTNLVQVGTNSDWMDVCCDVTFTFGIRMDGTLWVWGTKISGMSGRSGVYPEPTLVCRETNWLNFESGFGYSVWARNLLGELREPLMLPMYTVSGVLAAGAGANPEADAARTCALVSAGSLPGHVIGAISGTPKLYELRVDGSIWEKSYPLPGWTAPTDNWRRFGKRSDWVGIWGTGSTAIGLTADGTVWTWGEDFSRPPKFSFSARLAMLQVQIKQLVGSGPRRIAAFGPRAPAFQTTPRPLMRLTFPPAATNSAGQ